MKNLLVLFFILITGHVNSEDISWKSEHDGISVVMQLSPSTLHLNDELHLNLHLEYPSEFHFDKNQIVENLLWSITPFQSKWRVIQEPIQTITESNNLKFADVNIILAPMQIGIQSITLLKLSFESNESNKLIDFWSPIFKIDITPENIEAETLANLFPLEPQYRVDLTVAKRNELWNPANKNFANQMELTFAKHSFPWLFLLLVILGTVSILIWKFLRIGNNPEIPFIQNPKVKALEALENIRAKQMEEKDKYKQYYSSLTEVIRRYIEERYFVFGSSQTTDEFLVSITKDSTFSEKFQQLLEELLKDADRVKFENYHPDSRETEEVYLKAKSILSED
ncbi:MAG: hypothetical protein H0W88_06400 [Parachlamydiaceae bacterium]|nr:hypothetical protein [Parachlamydiaceae bacterium]